MKIFLVGPCPDARLPAALAGATDPANDAADFHNYLKAKFPKVHFDGGRK